MTAPAPKPCCCFLNSLCNTGCCYYYCSVLCDKVWDVTTRCRCSSLPTMALCLSQPQLPQLLQLPQLPTLSGKESTGFYFSPPIVGAQGVGPFLLLEEYIMSTGTYCLDILPPPGTRNSSSLVLMGFLCLSF